MASCSSCKTKQAINKKGEKRPILRKSRGILVCPSCDKKQILVGGSAGGGTKMSYRDFDKLLSYSAENKYAKLNK